MFHKPDNNGGKPKPKPKPKPPCFEKGVDYSENDLISFNNIDTPEGCQEKCQENVKCKFWTYFTGDDGICWLKSSKRDKAGRKNRISGPKYC